ncbi:hypothetical protein DFH07DRAFT_861504 [Mycena maculata]|uniref:Uncharacterized protein n=1 Tax=Mycena maculata TaxID=230809 RepID=A0AAD7MH48_9AGAR|nr:hypothetical protein DFH07DRAFT_861504 [Mycena maculata]
MLSLLDIFVNVTASTLLTQFVALTATFFIAWWYLLAMPVLGVLVRHRADYIPMPPRGLLEDGLLGYGYLQAAAAAVPRSNLVARVYRIEGLGGFYKGIVPSILTTLINVLAKLLKFVLCLHWNLGPHTPRTDAVLDLALALLLIPLRTLTTRAITTPHACALLSPAERVAPWLLYQAPGVAPAALLAAAAPALALPRPLAAALATTLKVLATRLALQRQGLDEDIYSGKDTADAVLAVRSRVPYTSLTDCARRIVREEGVGALFRAWEVEALKFLLW